VDDEKLMGMCRNFLLFIPANSPSLGALISYYSATANVNQEGDVHINDTLQGFGKKLADPFHFPGFSWVRQIVHTFSPLL
jgi:hypothetical protein